MPKFHYRWEWRLRSSPERLWPLAADTNRFNPDAGVPELELGEVRRAAAGCSACASSASRSSGRPSCSPTCATRPGRGPWLRCGRRSRAGELALEANGRRPFLLKVGIHTGPCIAVTQNERLDYFGSTVNLAARLVDLSSGADVVVSSAVTADPEVADLVGSGLSAAPIEATLKGFEDERFEIWSVD